MKTKILYLKKMASIGSLLVLILFCSSSYAQIIYTDIPDATPSVSFTLDLNNDAIDDFVIQFTMADKVMCFPQSSNAYAGEFVNGEYLSYALSLSNNICDTLATWYNINNPGIMGWGTTIGNWVGATDKYLALKLIVGANTYYGWARFDFASSSTSFTIKDYAYESTPNNCIAAGQTSTGIFENVVQQIASFFPNPCVTSTTLYLTNTVDNASLSICNSIGQEVRRISNISGTSVSISRDNLPGGVYFVTLIHENKIIAVEKLVLTDTR